MRESKENNPIIVSIETRIIAAEERERKKKKKRSQREEKKKKTLETWQGMGCTGTCQHLTDIHLHIYSRHIGIHTICAITIIILIFFICIYTSSVAIDLEKKIPRNWLWLITSYLPVLNCLPLTDLKYCCSYCLLLPPVYSRTHLVGSTQLPFFSLLLSA